MGTVNVCHRGAVRSTPTLVVIFCGLRLMTHESTIVAREGLVMRVILAAAAAVLLSGCWFIFIPGSVFGGESSAQSSPRVGVGVPDTRRVSAAGRRAYPAGEGEWCVDSDTREGEAVGTVDGRRARVIEILGSSTKCLDARYAVKARIAVLP